MEWVQVYDPLNSAFLSPLAAGPGKRRKRGQNWDGERIELHDGIVVPIFVPIILQVLYCPFRATIVCWTETQGGARRLRRSACPGLSGAPLSASNQGRQWNRKRNCLSETFHHPRSELSFGDKSF